MDLQLKGKLALVSGSTAGIGLATVTALAREGARVIVNGRQKPSVDTAMASIHAVERGQVLGFAGDLSDAATAERLAREFPDVEILINNLGIFEPKPFFDIPDEDWERFFQVNVMSSVRLSRHYAPGMKERGWGRIEFLSSESGVQIPVEMVHYGFTKTAMLAISRGLAETLAGSGVTVNAVLPGPTRSEGVGDFFAKMAGDQGTSTDELEAAFIREHRPSSLIKRLATTEEVANMCVYLASEQASATTGAALRVDGGVVRSAF